MESKLSFISLFASNLFPIFGVLFLQWNLSEMLFLYWCENIVVGFYNVLKMIKAQRQNETGITTTIMGERTQDKSKKGMVLFFIFHYGLFTLVHGVFLAKLLMNNISINSSLLMGIGFMFVSHGISYLTNYIGSGEYKTQSPESLMMAPYKRVVIMHLTVLFGSMFIVYVKGQSIGPLIVMSVTKTIIDFFSHTFEHMKVMPTGESRTKGKVFHLNPSFLSLFFPNYKKAAEEAYKMSVESGKWKEIKAQMDPKYVDEIERYWLENSGIKNTPKVNELPNN